MMTADRTVHANFTKDTVGIGNRKQMIRGDMKIECHRMGSKLSLTFPLGGEYNLSFFDMRGRQLFNAHQQIVPGVEFLVPLNLSQEILFLRVEGMGKTIIRRL